jgi:hypothetical protein
MRLGLIPRSYFRIVSRLAAARWAAKFGIALELSPIFVAGDQCYLFDWKSRLEQTARSFVTQIVLRPRCAFQRAGRQLRSY